MDEIKENYGNEEISELIDDENNDVSEKSDGGNDVGFCADEKEEYSDPTTVVVDPDIVEEQQHDHAPVEIDDEPPQQYEGYADDESIEENSNELDEEAINSFIQQLFQLKKKIL
jgi:hypothetical protein